MHASPSAFWCADHRLCVCAHVSIVELLGGRILTHAPLVLAQLEPAPVIFMALQPPAALGSGPDADGSGYTPTTQLSLARSILLETMAVARGDAVS